MSNKEVYSKEVLLELEIAIIQGNILGDDSNKYSPWLYVEQVLFRNTNAFTSYSRLNICSRYPCFASSAHFTCVISIFYGFLSLTFKMEGHKNSTSKMSLSSVYVNGSRIALGMKEYFDIQNPFLNHGSVNQHPLAVVSNLMNISPFINFL